MSYRDDQGRGYIPLEDNTLSYFITSPANIGTCALTQYKRRNTQIAQTSATARGDDFMAVMNVRSTPQHRGWINEREISVGASREGEFRLCDMRDSHFSEVSYEFHSVHLFMPNSAFGAKPGESIQWMMDQTNPIADNILRHLVVSLLYAVNDLECDDRLFCDSVLFSISRHVGRKYALIKANEKAISGTLTPHQERRVKELMMSRSSDGVSLDDIASSCGLSVDRFGRLFKKTTGMTPYRWLTGQRVENAKSLLRNPLKSIADVALDCGFANQSHFTQTFTKIAGISPGEWRRQSRF